MESGPSPMPVPTAKWRRLRTVCATITEPPESAQVRCQLPVIRWETRLVEDRRLRSQLRWLPHTAARTYHIGTCVKEAIMLNPTSLLADALGRNLAETSRS